MNIQVKLPYLFRNYSSTNYKISASRPADPGGPHTFLHVRTLLVLVVQLLTVRIVTSKRPRRQASP